jgi:ABC-type sulfate/molybdate transport systems ATPase subunit
MRVAYGAPALAVDPRVLLLDEAVRARSMPWCVRKLRRWLREIHRPYRPSPPVFVTHDQEEARELGRRACGDETYGPGANKVGTADRRLRPAGDAVRVRLSIGDSSALPVSVDKGPRPFLDEPRAVRSTPRIRA